MKKLRTLILLPLILIFFTKLNAQIKLDNNFNVEIPKSLICPTCLFYCIDLCELEDKSILAHVNYLAIQAPFKNENVLIKFSKTGVLDNVFGTNGKMKINSYEKIYADGNDFYTYSDSFYSDRYTIKKFDKNGVKITSWGNNGVFQSGSLNSDIYTSHLLVANSGLFATMTEIKDFSSELVITKIKNNVLDASFGVNGIKKMYVDSFPSNSKIYERKNGKLLVIVSVNYKNRIVQLNADGSVDVQFGLNGVLYPKFDFDTEFPTDIMEDKDNNILFLLSYLKNGAEYEAGIAKYNTNGNPITTFGTNGKLSFSCENKSEDVANNIMVQDNGTIITFTTYVSKNKAMFNHFNTNGQALTSYNVNANNMIINNGIEGKKTKNSVYVIGSGIQKYDYIFGSASKKVIEAKSNIQVYPNPVKNTLTIKQENLTPLIASIYQLDGKLVSKMELSQTSQILDLSSLASGVYRLTLSTDSKVLNSELIIKQ